MAGMVVVGGGQAGASLVAKLRAEGYDGPITLISEESVPPYQRPPLSKKYLLGEMALERLFLRPEAFYAEAGIALRLGTRVDGIDRDDKVVVAGGEHLAYDRLALVTGAVPRQLPPSIGGDLAGVHVVRTLRDIDALAPEVVAGARALVVGGGYIGLEAAAVLRTRDLHVTLIEAAPRILGRVACRETADWFRDLHEGQGVEIREGTALDRLTGDTKVTAARLEDGTEVEVDLVVVGIGVDPATGLAETAGLKIENGIAVDSQCRTSDPAIFAAGDCASFPWRGARVRLESVQNAIEQGEAAALNMLDRTFEYDPHPWFWSDQYDVKLQIAGVGDGADRIVARPGSRAGAASHWYFAGDTLVAVDAMNEPRAYLVGKRLIEMGRSPDPAALADPATELKRLLAG